MKLHLPSSLFRSVLAAMSLVAAFTCSPTAEAAHQHADVSTITYTDFGQNRGRYVTGNTNALLKHIRQQEGGVTISYAGGQADYTLEHGMVNLSGVIDSGGAGAIGYNFVASAFHVATTSPTFSKDTIGEQHAIQYKGIEYTYLDAENASSGTYFQHFTGGENTHDYKITRLNKIMTDVDGAAVYTGATSSLQGELLYRAGTGIMQKADHDGNLTYLTSGGYATGGIDSIDSVSSNFANTPEGSFSAALTFTPGSEGVSEDAPLPFKGNKGDSGSPGYVWNEQTGQYEYLAAASKAGDALTVYRGNTEWTIATMNAYNQVATVGADNSLYLGAIEQAGDTITDGSVSTTLYSGNATNANGDVLATYKGVQSGTNTWKKLNNYKDTQNWYNYDNSELNADYTAGGTGAAQFDLSYADLFYNDNLVIKNTTTADQTVVLNATVDLGIGYVQFSKGAELENANYIVQSAGTGDYLLNSAGFVVDEGVSVHMQLTNPADYMREWRKVGAGDLYIEGSGNNDIFLNLGGSGTTYLQRGVEFGMNWDGNYAAYNVLVNNGATVVINDTDQIKRDLTFGNGGGVLDINGNSMTWNNANNADAAGFTIHALDEQAIITNSKAGKMATTLTWTQSGEQTWLGSFVDTTTGELTFKYDGGAGSRLTMHSIHTNLSNNANSGMEVSSGTLALEGTNTVHGLGSLNGIDTTRYENADDWHYADASSNVTVNNGGTFELGSHARLTGTVTVNSGGTFVMREGVRHQMEYIEGGQELENTDNIRDFFGLKGNVNLSGSTAAMKVQFSEGTDSTLEYGYRISGSGSLSVDAGMDGGFLQLTGDNSGHTGSKAVVSGGLHAASDAALGNTSTNKWLIEEKGWLASDSFTSADTILEHIDGNSTGVLALTSDIADEISLEGHQGLIIGAMEGCEVEYGTADKSLSAVNGKWTLGGGGGTLIVNFLLEGNHELVLGNEYGKGNVHLTNSGNDISSITFAGGVKLSYENGALDNVGVSLAYGSSIEMLNASHLLSIARGAEGAMLVDNVATADIDLSEHQKLSLSSGGDCRYTGDITLAEGADYHFGGSTSTFTVATALEAGHDLVIDGQGWSGGSVVLEKASAVDGDVIIRGYDTARTTEALGSVTLQLAEDNGLAKAVSVNVENGGSVELAGTEQRFNQLTLGSSGSIQDSSADRSGTLVLTGETVLNGNLNVASVIKTGEGNVTLGGTNTTTRFEVQGTGDNVVTLTSTSSTYAQGTLAVSNATLDLSHKATQGVVEAGEGAQLINMGTMQTLHITGDSTGDYRDAAGTINPASKTISITTLRLDEGSHFTLTAAPSTANALSIGTLNGAGDVTVNINKTTSTSMGALSAVSLQGNNLQFTGTLAISSDCEYMRKSQVSFGSRTSFGSGVVSLNGVQVFVQTANQADTAITATLDIGSRGVEFTTSGMYFTGLSGSGQLVGTNMSFLGDLRQFSGAIQGSTSGVTTFGGAGKNYHSITGDNSVQAINLFSNSSARLLGYTSSSSYYRSYQFQYADDVILNATVSDKASVTQAGTGTLVLNQTNTATGTLTINEGGSVELAGNGSWAGSLAGSGTLVNSSSAAVTFSDVSGFNGSLSLAEGSSLTATGNYSLNSDESLGVFAVEGITTGASLNLSSLTLNGGSLSFSAEALVDSENAALITNATIAAGSSLAGQTINLSGTSALASGSYLLASGDWSALSGTSFTVNGIDDYLTGSVSASSSGLLLTLSQAQGIQLWNGTSEQSSWTADTFGTTAAGSGNAYFTDSAASKEVSISGAVSADALIFNTTKDYVLTPESGATLTADSLELKDSGKVTLGSGITISGATTLAEGSELVVKNFSTLGGAVTGAGTVTIDAGAAEGSLEGSMSSLETLQIVSGRYNAKGSTVQANHVVVQGGQFYIWSTGTYDYDLTLSGKGWTDNQQTYADAALRSGGGNVYLQGKVTVGSDITVAVTEGNTLWLNGQLEGNGNTITKTGSKTLWLNTSSSFSANDVSFVVKEGLLCLGGTFSKDLPGGINSIAVQNGAKLGFHTRGCEFATTLSLEGGATLDFASGVSSNTSHQSYTLTGDVTLSTAASGQSEVVFSSTYQRSVVLEGALSGDATLAVGGSHTNAFNLTLSSEDNSDFTGGLIVETNRKNVTINLAGAGSAGTGAIELGNDSALLKVAGNAEGYGRMVNTISGTGKLHVTMGGLELTGNNSYSGGTTVADNASLKLGNAAAAGTGTIALSNAASSLVYAGAESGAASPFANDITGEGSVTIASGNVEFSTSKAYTGATTVAKGAELTLSAANTASSAYVVQQGGALKLAEGGSLSVADAVSVSARRDEATLGNTSLTAGSLAATTTAPAEVVGANIAVSSTTFSMSGLALVDSSVTLQDTALNLSDIMLAGGSTISGQQDGTQVVDMSNVSFMLDGSSAYTIVVDADGSLFGADYIGKKVAVYDISHFSNVELSGSMMMDISAMPAATAATGNVYDALAFNFSGSGVTLADNFALSSIAGDGGSTLDGTRVGSGNTYVFNSPMAGDAVPEPTSSALALLGLGALALRRRRK